MRTLKNSGDVYGLSFHSTDSHIFSNLFRERAASGSGISLIHPSMKQQKQTTLPPSINDRTSDNHSFEFIDDLDIQDSASMGSLSTNSTIDIEERGNGSADTFTINISPSNQKFHLPPIDTSNGTRAWNEFNTGYSSMDFSSASEVRRIRKISKVTNKTKTQQEDLAEAIIKGDVTKLEEIIDVLGLLYGERGFAVIMSYSYEYNPETHLVRLTTKPDKNKEDDFYTGLNIVHLACIFDQQQAIEFLSMYGVAKIRRGMQGTTDPVHTAAWFGAVAPLHSLRKLGWSLQSEDKKKRTPMHYASLRNNDSALKYLLNATDCLDAKDAEGKTPLHVAAQVGSMESAKLLISHGADVNAVDSDNATPLHLATDHNVINMLLEKGGDPTIKMLDEDSSKSSVFSQYLRTVPNECNSVLTSFITKNNVSLSAQSLEVGLSFKLWQSELRDKEMDPLMKIIKTGNLDILKHPVCEAFLHMKDSHTGVHFRRAYFIFYVLYVISITGLVFTNHSPWFSSLFGSSLNTLYYGFLSTSLFFVVILIIKEILTVIFFWTHFINTKSNILWILLLNIVTIYTFLVSNRDLLKQQFTLQLGTASVFISWIYITFVIGRFPSIGIYIIMVQKVSKVLILFLLLFSCSLIAFALSFHLILPGEGHEDPLASFITTLSMMFGELDFASKFYKNVVIYHGITQFIAVCFIIFIGIVIMNFLIGLSIDNISTLFQTAGVNRLKLTVEHVSMKS